MRPEDMNTIHSNGKAFNGNYAAVAIAGAAIILAVTGLVVEFIRAAI